MMSRSGVFGITLSIYDHLDQSQARHLLPRAPGTREPSREMRGMHHSRATGQAEDVPALRGQREAALRVVN